MRSSRRRRSAMFGRVVAPALVCLVGLTLAAGCGYTGDMNVQPMREAYNARQISQPFGHPSPAANSVPTNPTPTNYWGIPYTAQPSPAPGLATSPYVGVSPVAIGSNTGTPNDQASVARGMVLYREVCLSCHGANAKGGSTLVGSWFQRQTGKAPADLTSADVQNLPDSQLYDVITNGFGAMPALRTELAPPERWDVIHYLRTLK